MKKLTEKKWFWPVAVVAAVLIIALILFLFLCGFRITYAPELENDWDAVSAVAAWAGVLASFIAIWFAIQIPKKIAERQDKIALFEKRYDAYSSILSLQTFAFAVGREIFDDEASDLNGKVLTLEDKIGLYCLHFSAAFGYPLRVQKGQENFESMVGMISLLKQYEVKASMLPLLFYTTDEESDKMKQELSEIFEALLCFMTEVTTFTFDGHSKLNDTYRKNFVASLMKFKIEYSEKFENKLTIEKK